MPTLNEAEHVEFTLRGVLDVTPELPVWVVDGGSTDGTREIVRALATQYPGLQLVDNPAVTQANATNLAARRASWLGYDVLVRMDVHAIYPSRFVDRLLATLERTGADSVVVPMVTVGRTRFGKAARDVFNSWVGHGGSPHRANGESSWVEHGHHAAFRLPVYLAIGGYDTRFRANEDVEFDLRLVRSGGRIFMDTALAVNYLPRQSVRKTWRQFHRNGRGRVMTARKHRTAPGLRQALPILLVPSLIGSIVLALAVHPAFLAAPIAYLAAVLGLAACHARRKRLAHVGRMCAIATASHIGFGMGAIQELCCRSAVSRRAATTAADDTTRAAIRRAVLLGRRKAARRRLSRRRWRTRRIVEPEHVCGD